MSRAAGASSDAGRAGTGAQAATTAATSTLFETRDDGRVALRVLLCGTCGATSFPATAYGCSRCGTARSRCRAGLVHGPFVLRNYVSVHQPLLPALRVPFVVGDVEIAPGIVEEAIIDVASEDALHVGMPLRAVVRAGAPPAPALRFVLDDEPRERA